MWWNISEIKPWTKFAAVAKQLRVADLYRKHTNHCPTDFHAMLPASYMWGHPNASQELRRWPEDAEDHPQIHPTVTEELLKQLMISLAWTFLCTANYNNFKNKSFTNTRLPILDLVWRARARETANCVNALRWRGTGVLSQWALIFICWKIYLKEKEDRIDRNLIWNMYVYITQMKLENF